MHAQHGADEAGQGAPAKEDAPAIDRGAQGEHPNFAAELRPEKHLSTLRARATLLGATLRAIDDDRGVQIFIVTRWGAGRELPTIEAVAHLLDRMEGRCP